MFSYIIDIFCKDTVVGLSGFSDIRRNTIYKNKYSPLFRKRRECQRYNKYSFIDQFACHL